MHETLRAGRYVLLGSFAEGAQAKTFDAVDKREGRAVVVKRMEVRDAKTWKDVELAERETQVLKSLSHPRLPAYFDNFEEGGALFLVMQKIEGESLGSIKRRGGIFSEKEVKKLLLDASDVLAYLHHRVPPVIHRDLKPGNVIKKQDGSFAFVDFGAVRDKLKADGGGSTVVGTFGYMAPEQFQGRALPASDVYAIGATALTMLTGREPEDLPHKGLGIDVRAATKGLASESLVTALEKMLEPDPDQRATSIPRLDGASAKKNAEGRSNDRDGRDRGEERSRLESADRRREDRKAARRAERDARRARKKARRQAREAIRAERGSAGPFRIAWPIAVLFSVGLALSEIGIVLALRVIVPLVLNIVAMVVARERLRAASAAVRAASDRAVGRVHDAHQWVQDARESGAPRVRVDGAIPEKERAAVRVAAAEAQRRAEEAREDEQLDDEELDDEDLDDEEELPSERAREGKRRRTP